ncbi:unnamed protein product [Acanthoscelides obtectus]|uniref:Uncharacterized protein n=1 Tax=Acanthoscelides obtectus TaxID=200917 RepID=A0A9P0QCH3_ACAOB|nr:unnamed protein product [Acanthoscelides obtectus]CAK1626598.1 hypothetical protein AOBTE_LOCUS3967 [Acanthoscelides obtectus]
MKDPEDGDNVEKYSDNNDELSDGKERWSCPACCKQGRVTRSGSTSSTCGARSETTAPLQPDQSTPTDTLTLILNHLSTMASDIKDIKNSQSQLRTDVAYCRNLLQQHSDSISRHVDLIAACETNIQISRLLKESCLLTLLILNRDLQDLWRRCPQATALLLPLLPQAPKLRQWSYLDVPTISF